MARKSLRDEVIQSNVINISWTTILRALNSKTISEEDKRTIAMKVVEKTCPKEIKFDGNIGLTLTEEQRNRLIDYLSSRNAFTIN